MGESRRLGIPYSWITDHLADADGRIGPRSFMEALRKAAEHTTEQHPKHRHALHYEGIRHGALAASAIRINELREDYPWVDQVLAPLVGMSVPFEFRDIAQRWREEHLPERLKAADGGAKLPPRRVDEGANGIREDLEQLGIFQRLDDDWVNVTEVFRAGYRLGRKGGVKPVQ